MGPATTAAVAASSSPTYTRAHVDHCAFAAWYPRLQHVAIKGTIIPLPAPYVRLLLADGVRLETSAPKNKKTPREATDQDGDDDDDAGGAANGGTEEQIAERRVRAEIERVLAAYGGQAFPKLNWSCPQDAAWMLGGGLKCTSYEDVFLLLKASDFVVHDLTEPYAGCEMPPPPPTVDDEEQPRDETNDDPAAPVEPYLVLKKWCNFYDSMHFRCFVVEHALVGISQRHCGEFYDFLLAQQDHLCELIYGFFHAHLRDGPRSVFPDPDYIFDVYVDKQHRVFLVDINVFGGVTDPALFLWEELLELRAERRRRRALVGGLGGEEEVEEDEDEQVVDFRIVETSKGIRPNPLSSYRTPTDFVDHLAASGGFEAFIDQVRRDNSGIDDSSDDDEASHEDADNDDDVQWGSDDDNYD